MVFCCTRASRCLSIGTLCSVLPEPMRTSFCRARVIATLMRRQSASSAPADSPSLLRTKLIRMQSLSRPCRAARQAMMHRHHQLSKETTLHCSDAQLQVIAA